MTRTLRILGGGPAGTCAALAAIREGAEVELIERSRFPRHKVCGEFLSPEIAPVLERAGALASFQQLKPHRVTRMSLVLGSRSRTALLPEPAYGLSRYALDQCLWSQAMLLGATAHSNGSADVIATGRPSLPSARGARLFGFKAHFEGPADDAVELYFLDACYVGVSCVEGGRTNVCGLAPEWLLNKHGFEPESLMTASAALRSRLDPLHRTMRWIFTGPLGYAQHWNRTDAYLAGDALSFVDPFTGSGLLTAAITGVLAGVHAARGCLVAEHRKACRSAIRRPFLFSSLLRSVAGTAWAERLLPYVPAQLLFHLTRPRAIGL